ncbi:MAG: carbohydrate porin [Nibricoccus sp.]
MFGSLKPLTLAALASGCVCLAFSHAAKAEPTANNSAQALVEEKPVVQPLLTLTGEFWSNVHGGTQTGSRWLGVAALSVEVDLARIGGAKNSAFIAQIYGLKNQHKETGITDLTGAFNSVSGWDAEDMLRVGNLHYRQTWRDDATLLKVGQLGIDDDFVGSDYVSLFANAAFATTPAQIATPLDAETNNAYAFGGYAVYTPGIFVSTKLSEIFNFQTGVYYGGPGQDEKKNHGYSYENASTSGVVVFAEAAWRFPVLIRTSTLRLGGAYHTGKFDNFSALLSGAENTTVRGLYSFYIGHDIVLCADSKGDPAVAVFWRGAVSPQQDRSVVKTYFDAGFNWFGPIASRPHDTAGVAISRTKFGRDYRALTGPDTLARYETTVEFTYRAHLTSHWSVQAGVQLFRHASDSEATGNFRSATVLGVRTELAF